MGIAVSIKAQIEQCIDQMKYLGVGSPEYQSASHSLVNLTQAYKNVI